MVMRGIGKIALGACALIAVGGVVPAAAGSGHDAVHFSMNGEPNSVFRIREGTATVQAEIEVTRGQHGAGPATIDVETAPSTAGNPAQGGSDYTPIDQRLQFQGDCMCYEGAEARVPVLADGEVEPLESVGLHLDEPTGGVIRISPSQATLYIVDSDGPSRVFFEVGAKDAFENERPFGSTGPAVEIRLYRSGSFAESETVQVETSEGTAEDGSDFLATSSTVTFVAGDWSERVLVPLVNDSEAEGDESFTVSVTGNIASPSTMTVTILDTDSEQPEDDVPPYTAWHQPLHKEKYGAAELENFIAFMQDDIDGIGMERVQMAIRMKRDDETCRWWNGTSFRQGSCLRKRWAQMGPGTETRVEYFEDTALFTLGKRLKGSGPRSDIHHYTAYSRGWDKAGNVQNTFIKGQNRNNFDVRGGS